MPTDGDQAQPADAADAAQPAHQADQVDRDPAAPADTAQPAAPADTAQPADQEASEADGDTDRLTDDDEAAASKCKSASTGPVDIMAIPMPVTHKHPSMRLKKDPDSYHDPSYPDANQSRMNRARFDRWFHVLSIEYL